MTRVYIRSPKAGSREVYHLDQDCMYLRNADRTISTRQLSDVKDRLRCCSECQDGGNRSGGSKDIFMAAKRAGQEAQS